MMRGPRCVRSSRGFGAVALAIMLAAGRVHAQSDDQIICPLSEEQQSNSQSAWATLAAVFKHDRCSNCHGKKNPFTADTEHPDRQKLELDENGEISEKGTFDICQGCHDQAPGSARWKIPPADQQWWNQSVDELCRTQHKKRPPFQFIGHSTHDPLIVEAFKGLMALNDDAKDLVETTPYPNPPPMGHSEFIESIRSWLDAQGLTDNSQKWRGDQVDCGCVPQDYEIVLETILFSLPVYPGCDGAARMSETVPITFTAESHYMGTASGTFTVSNVSCRGGCTADYRPTTTSVHLMGEVLETDGVPDKLTLTTARRIQATSFDVTCPCEDPGDCPYPVTVFVPEIEAPTFDVEPPLPARLDTYEWVQPTSSTTITIRKRN